MADGAVVSLWRYPVTTAMGVGPNKTDVTVRGLLGDRSLALTLNHDDGGDGVTVASDETCFAVLRSTAFGGGVTVGRLLCVPRRVLTGPTRPPG